MKTNIIEIRRMQKLAGLINESIENEENIEEGWKSWVAGGLLALSTLGGGLKVYKMDKELENDRKAQIEYYENVLSKAAGKMTPEQKSDLGSKINEKTKKYSLATNTDISSEEWADIMERYADSYIESHPKEFSISAKDGTLHWNLENAAAY
jgi:hypothetical protein